jgi:hypothetical protein
LVVAHPFSEERDDLLTGEPRFAPVRARNVDRRDPIAERRADPAEDRLAGAVAR